MKFEEYRQYDATDLAELIKTKEVTAEEVNQTTIEGIEETLFKLAVQLEEVNGWGKSFPNLI